VVLPCCWCTLVRVSAVVLNGGHFEDDLGSISRTFYEQLLHTHIPKAQKTLMSWLYFLCFWDLRVYKLQVKCWWNWHLVEGWRLLGLRVHNKKQFHKHWRPRRWVWTDFFWHNLRSNSAFNENCHEEEVVISHNQHIKFSGISWKWESE